MALVDVVRSVVQASVQVPSSKEEPLRAAVDVKVGGATCNVSPNLDPWLTIALGAVKLLQSRKSKGSAVGKSGGSLRAKGEAEAEGGTDEAAAGEPAVAEVKKKKSSKLLWDIAVSAPDAVLVLYGPYETEVLKVSQHPLKPILCGRSPLHTFWTPQVSNIGTHCFSSWSSRFPEPESFSKSRGVRERDSVTFRVPICGQGRFHMRPR